MFNKILFQNIGQAWVWLHIDSVVLVLLTPSHFCREPVSHCSLCPLFTSHCEVPVFWYSQGFQNGFHASKNLFTFHASSLPLFSMPRLELATPIYIIPSIYVRIVMQHKVRPRDLKIIDLTEAHAACIPAPWGRAVREWRQDRHTDTCTGNLGSVTATTRSFSLFIRYSTWGGVS